MATYNNAIEIIIPKLNSLGIPTVSVRLVAPHNDEDWVVEAELFANSDNTAFIDYVDLALYGSPLDKRFVWWYKGNESKYCLTDKEVFREYKKIVAKSLERLSD
jgi:hypothetical protein